MFSDSNVVLGGYVPVPLRTGFVVDFTVCSLDDPYVVVGELPDVVDNLGWQNVQEGAHLATEPGFEPLI